MIIFMLAAGLGTRLRPATNLHPKPCIPFLNVPMGLYNFRYIKQLPIEQLVVNTFHLPEQIQELYMSQTYFENEITFSNEINQILGSSGGLKKASHLFKKTADSTILLMNADEILFNYDQDFLDNAYRTHIEQDNWATLVVMKHPDAGGKFGAIWCDGESVKLIGKQSPSAKATPYHYIGFTFLKQEVLETIPDNQETNIFYDILKHQLADKKVGIHEIKCDWYETGNYEDYLLGTQSVLANIDKKTLDFISVYDESILIKNPTGRSLVSKHFQQTYPQLIQNLHGSHVISKTTNPNSFKNLGSDIQNSVFFKDIIISK